MRSARGCSIRKPNRGRGIMMRSTFHLLETSKRSLFTQMAALQTTGHNIANANTPGFSRQVVNMNATRPIEAVGLTHSTAPGQLGTGVEFGSITRIREKFLDDQYRNENKSLGSFSVQADTLDKLEGIINEPSDSGVRTVLDNFWKSWSDLSKDPENVAARKIVRENAVALADAFNFTSKQLSDLSTDLTTNIATNSQAVNSLATTIANLNGEIYRIESMGDDANDLRDQRDLLTDQLSKLVNINVVDTDQGYTIDMGSVNLVTAGTMTGTTPESLAEALSSGDLNSGEIYGMFVSRDKFVADYQNQLNTLADTIANGDVTVTIPAGSVLPDGIELDGVVYSGGARYLDEPLTVTVQGINGLHKLGFTLNDPLEEGGDFFVSKSGGNPITAADFALNPDIANDATKIATSMRTSGTGTDELPVKGNNTLAILISQLKDTSFKFESGGSVPTLANGTIDSFFGAVVGQLGVQSQEATRQLNNQKSLTDQIDSRRQSVSGVSLDEEMANMIKFQHAYGAAARVMTVFDEMLDKIINGMGVVGR